MIANISSTKRSKTKKRQKALEDLI